MMQEESYVETLQTNQLQLKEVELMLMSEPDNAQLLTLKKDLVDAITLLEQVLLTDVPALSNTKWKMGDVCLAPWTDGHYHEAKVDEIIDSDLCSITFKDSKITEPAQLKVLKPFVKSSIATKTGIYTKKNQFQAKKEYQKKRAEKKADKLKEKDTQAEVRKSDWKKFNTSYKTKKAKYQKGKESIFATPESYTGKVGIGTCNTGGRPMTDFQMQNKVNTKKVDIFKPKFE